MVLDAYLSLVTPLQFERIETIKTLFIITTIIRVG